MDKVGDLLDIAFKKPQRIGIRQHESGNLICRHQGPEMVYIHPAFRIVPDGNSLIAAKGTGSRIGAMGRVGIRSRSACRPVFQNIS